MWVHLGGWAKVNMIMSNEHTIHVLKSLYWCLCSSVNIFQIDAHIIGSKPLKTGQQQFFKSRRPSIVFPLFNRVIKLPLLVIPETETVLRKRIFSWWASSFVAGLEINLPLLTWIGNLQVLLSLSRRIFVAAKYKSIHHAKSTLCAQRYTCMNNYIYVRYAFAYILYIYIIHVCI